jgi:hypothetical protein
MLKFQVKDAEEIPEGMEDFYKAQEDGTFILKVEGAVEKDRLDEFRANNKALMDELDSTRNSLQTIDADFNAFKTDITSKYGDVDIEAYNEMVANQRALKEQTLIEEGKHKELLALREDELRNEFAANQNKIKEELAQTKKANAKVTQELNDQLSKLLIDNKLTALAAQYQVRSTALQDVLARGKGTWRLEDGVAVAYDGKGNKMYNADGVSPLDMSTWMESLSVNAAHLFETSSGSGEDLNIDELLGLESKNPDNTPERKPEPGHEYMVGPLADIRDGLESL